MADIDHKLYARHQLAKAEFKLRAAKIVADLLEAGELGFKVLDELAEVHAQLIVTDSVNQPSIEEINRRMLRL